VAFGPEARGHPGATARHEINFSFRGRIAAGSKFVAKPRKSRRVSRLGQSDDYLRRITHSFCGLFWLRALLTRGIMPRKQYRRIAYSARTGSANPKEAAQARAGVTKKEKKAAHLSRKLEKLSEKREQKGAPGRAARSGGSDGRGRVTVP
jgi:hypothetical protein